MKLKKALTALTTTAAAMSWLGGTVSASTTAGDSPDSWGEEMWKRVWNAAKMSRQVYKEYDYYEASIGTLATALDDVDDLVADDSANTDKLGPYVAGTFYKSGNYYAIIAFAGKDMSRIEESGNWFTTRSDDQFGQYAKNTRDADGWGDICDKDEDDNDTTDCCKMNPWLTQPDYDMKHGTLKTALNACKTSNGDVPCEVILAGHSRGGVLAQRAAIELKTWFRTTYTEDSSYTPTVLAFGSAAAIPDGGGADDDDVEADYGCTALDGNYVHHFANVKRYSDGGWH